MPDRCVLTELLTDQCAHCRPAPARPPYGSRPLRSGATIAAQFRTVCACCEEEIAPGEQIAYSADADGWCLTDHLQA